MSSCCLFSLSPKIQPKNILSAQLWVHLRPADKFSTVFLQISRLKPASEGNSTRVRVRSLKIDTDPGTSSWQSVDIKSLLQVWLRQPETNYGIEINAFNSKGEDLAVTSAEPGEEGLVRETGYECQKMYCIKSESLYYTQGIMVDLNSKLFKGTLCNLTTPDQKGAAYHKIVECTQDSSDSDLFTQLVFSGQKICRKGGITTCKTTIHPTSTYPGCSAAS